LRRAGRKATALDRPFPHAYPVKPPSPEARTLAGAFWDARDVANDGVFTACFFGVFSRKCDLAVVIDAAARLEREGLALRVVLCGSGEEEARLRRRAAGLRSVRFPGWVGAAEIRVLMDRAHAGLAPYRNHAGFIGNLPNKPIEYLAGGLPVVSSLTGGEADLLYREGCAVSFRAGDAENLAAVLRGLAEQPAVQTRMAAAARSVFAARFSADGVYAAMADWLETVANSRRVKSG
jgi:glycosyltransferase involved in cell wall biosynthesis